MVAATSTANPNDTTAAAATTDVDEVQGRYETITETESSRSDTNNLDIGLYVGKSLDDACKERLLKAAWIDSHNTDNYFLWSTGTCTIPTLMTLDDLERRKIHTVAIRYKPRIVGVGVKRSISSACGKY